MSFSLTVASGTHRLLSSQSPERHFQPVHIPVLTDIGCLSSLPQASTPKPSLSRAAIYLPLVSLVSLSSSHFSYLPLPMKLNLLRVGQIQNLFSTQGMCWWYQFLSLFPTPSLICTLFHHPIRPFLVLPFTPLSLHPPIFISLPPFFFPTVSSPPPSPPYSPHLPYLLYIFPIPLPNATFLQLLTHSSYFLLIPSKFVHQDNPVVLYNTKISLQIHNSFSWWFFCHCEIIL